MLQFNARRFVRMMAVLGKIEVFCRERSKDENTRLPETGRSDILNRLNELQEDCKNLSLDTAVRQIKRIESRLDNITYSDFSRTLEELHDRINDQLEQRLFVFIPTNKAKY